MTAATATGPLGTLIEGLPDAVLLVDAVSLLVLAANATAGRLLGMAPPALCGQPAAGLGATPEDECFWNDVAQGLADNIASETLVQHGDGTLLPVTRSVQRVVLAPPDGPAEAIYVVALHDRSAARRADAAHEALLAELQATLESTADGILVTDMAGRVGAFNQRFAALWGVQDDLLTTMPCAPGCCAVWPSRKPMPNAWRRSSRRRCCRPATPSSSNRAACSNA